MTIRLNTAVVGEDGTDWQAGDVREASAHFARELMRRGCAVPASEDVQVRDPAPMHRDPKPAAKRKR